MFRRLVLLAAVLGLAGCMQQRPVVDAKQYRSAIVIAALPDTLSYNYIGFTVLQNHREVAAVDWNLSTHALDQLAKALGQRFEVTKLAVDPMTLTGLRAEGEVLKPGTASRVSEAVKQAVAGRSADLVIFMDAVTGLDAGDKTKRWPRFGAYLGEQAFGAEAGTRVGVIASYHVFDGRSFALITTASSSDRVTFPERIKGEPWASVPESTQARVRDAVISALPTGIAVGLRQIGLGEK
jgi:hypothetical protein